MTRDPRDAQRCLLMKQRRGQSFETMMLVVSVIVAVAILGILLGFLKIIPDMGVNAKEVMPSLVSKINAQGYGLEIQEKVMFNDGDRIYRQTVVGQAPIAEDHVQFVCDDVLCGDASKPLTVTSTSIVTNKKIIATVAICLGNDGIYKVVVGSMTSEVSKKAEQECGLA